MLLAKLPFCPCLCIAVKDDPLCLLCRPNEVSVRLSELIKADSPPPTTHKFSVPSCQLLHSTLTQVMSPEGERMRPRSAAFLFL